MAFPVLGKNFAKTNQSKRTFVGQPRNVCLERDQEKWNPVFRPITRPAKDSGAGYEAALFPPKAIPL
jgi:hypothetical protein